MAKKHAQACPIAGFLNLFGDAWTLMVIREAFSGVERFTDIRKNTGIAKNLLSSRLSTLVEEGVLRRENVGERGTRYAYKLTDKGRTLGPIFQAMHEWGNEHVFGPGNEPVLLEERDTGKPVRRLEPVSHSGEALNWSDIVVKPGPGADAGTLWRMRNVQRAGD